MRKCLKALIAATAVIGMTGAAQAANLYLTGHDVLLHGGQNGYDGVIMDFLRNAGQGNEVAKAGYTISFVGTANVGGGRLTGSLQNIPSVGNGGTVNLAGTSLAGYGGAKFYDAQTADWSQVLAADALVILSHTTCGGCSLTTAGSAAINAQSAAIAAAFNGGMDIWANSGASLATYYDFLPPAVAASGASISGSTGFVATLDGLAIGIQPNMINGFPTHNRFASFDPALTVFETRPVTGGIEDISIGARNIGLGGGGVIPDDPSDVPAPPTLILLGTALALLGAGGMFGPARRRGDRRG